MSKCEFCTYNDGLELCRYPCGFSECRIEELCATNNQTAITNTSYGNLLTQDGINLYWSIYQYDKDNIELVPVDPFKKPAEDD